MKIQDAKEVEMSKHTPGPWEYQNGGIWGSGDIQKYGWIGRINGRANASYSDKICEGFGDMRLPGPAANVALSIVAPEMYEALYDLVQADDVGMGREAVSLRIELARAVLVKAERKEKP